MVSLSYAYSIIRVPTSSRSGGTFLTLHVTVVSIEALTSYNTFDQFITPSRIANHLLCLFKRANFNSNFILFYLLHGNSALSILIAQKRMFQRFV